MSHPIHTHPCEECGRKSLCFMDEPAATCSEAVNAKQPFLCASCAWAKARIDIDQEGSHS